MALSIKHLSPVGVEVDVDLKDPSTHDDVARLYEQHGLLVFRNQDLTFEQQKAVMARLGPVLEDWTTVGYVSNTRADGMLGDSEVSYHSDFMFTPEPGLGNSLLAVDVQPNKTWTRYASLVNAYRKLPADLRAKLDGLKGLNLFSSTAEALRGRQLLDDYPEDAPRAAHDVLRIDPITKQPVVYVSEQNTAQIVGLDHDESEAVLAELHKILLAPENIYEHRWSNGDLVIWANQAFLHARGGLTPGETRTLQRVCISNAPADLYRPPVPADRLPVAMRTM